MTGVSDSLLSPISYPSLTTAASMLVDAMTSIDSVFHELRMGYEIRRRESTR